MNGRTLLCTVALLSLVCTTACAQVAQPTGASAPRGVSEQEWDQGFVPLFNGTDLTGWQVIGTESWSVKDGAIECSGEGFGWIRSETQYRDFILRLEYRISPGGNSGIFIRAGLKGLPWTNGMEIQVLDDYGNPPDVHSAGALYDVVAPGVNASKPAGEWNEVEIQCWGERLAVFLNGQKLYSINLSDPALSANLAPGHKLTERPKMGYIGLQNHGSAVAFRNIRVNDGSRPLFNGRDLSGWHVMGAETWSVQDGVLQCAGGGGGWLRSDRQYRDFVLSLEYKVAPNGNSGIFLRSTLEGNPAFTGMEVQILDDHGKPPDIHSAGALYDAVAPAVNASRPAGQWNQAHIICWGDNLTVFMNGQKLYQVNLADPALNAAQVEERKFTNRAKVGYIGLQNHGYPVYFRNLRINEGFVPIFNGRDLEGWRTVRPADASWSVQDGVLVCSGAEGDYIYYDAKYANFVLRLQYRISPNGNSGVFFRVGSIYDFPGSGAEVQILDSYGGDPSPHGAGAIYGIIAPSKNMARPADQWNQFEITCWDGRLTVVMNGEQVVDVSLNDYDHLRNLPGEGYLGLQNHGSRVEFRDIWVKTASWEPPVAVVEQ